MKKIILSLILGILLINLVVAATMSRTGSTTVSPGQQFTITYSTASLPARWFVAWEDTITGGCTPTSYRNFMAGETSANDQKQVTFTAPSSGSCTFTGYYQYSGSAQTNFPNLVVQVQTGGAPTCTSWTYSAWGDCQPSNLQYRTVTSSSPSGCTGGNPITQQSCVYNQNPVTVGTMTRTGPSSISPGQTFQIAYATSSISGRWFVAWEDAVSGGCSPTSYRNFMASETGGSDQKVVTYTAPSSGSCSFSGFYQFSGDNQKNFASLSIPVSSSPIRDCTNRECGPDGVGGSCGTCPSGESCNAAQQCVADDDNDDDGPATPPQFCQYVEGMAWLPLEDLDTCANGTLTVILIALGVVLVIGKL